MIDTTVPGSDGWWLQRLAEKLAGRRKRLEDLDEWFRGDPPLPEGAGNAREAYRAFQRKARTNYAELIVEAGRERMTPAGFRTAVGDDENGDVEARRIWEANGLDVESASVHESMLSMGDGYVIVGGVNPRTGAPAITGEDPRQVVTIHDPVQQRHVRAALKLFHDPEDELDYAYLYLPGRAAVAAHRIRRTAARAVRFSAITWEWVPELGGQLPLDTVPVVRFRNRRGVGEFEPHLDLLGRINHQILQRMVIATMQAFRQRAIKGDLPEVDADGNPVDYNELFVADPGALWLLPEAAEMWESGQVDLTPILSAVKDDVRDLAAVTRTPLSYLTPDAVSQSAEGAALMREGLVFKVEDRIKRATEGWKDVMSLALQIAGDTERADRGSLEVLWASPERRSLAERADAASKAQDIPWRTRMIEVWQFSPAQVNRMEAERATDAFLAPAEVPAAL